MFLRFKGNPLKFEGKDPDFFKAQETPEKAWRFMKIFSALPLEAIFDRMIQEKVRKMASIGFIGAGIVATALAVRLSERGYEILAVSSRSRDSAEKLARRISNCRVAESNQEVASLTNLVFIVTSDDAIASVVESVQWHQGQSVIHCNGAASTDLLEGARSAGAQVGCFHPLQTFASLKEALENLPGSTFGIEAEEPLYSLLANMALDLEGRSIRLTASAKVLYHVAAVITSNYTVTLMKMATDLWGAFEVPAAEATSALLPLLRGTVNNIAKVGLPHGLTGPIARGDIGTLRQHLVALQKHAPGVLGAYRQMGLQTISLALAKGTINKETAGKMKALLESQKS
jgi:predicted short-subunit dehydrogenase-like oxidoreductase (DUF2520 family)